MGYEISRQYLIKETKFTNVFKQSAIILPLLDPVVVCNILLWKVAFYQ